MEYTDGITAGVELRKQRGLEIAALAKIGHGKYIYYVPSQERRNVRYRVGVRAGSSTCTCRDYETRGCKCKHIYAVEYVIRREKNDDGSTTVRESVTVTRTRKTYPQDWPKYNRAQVNEKREFQALLHDLCSGVTSPPRAGRGRPSAFNADMVFAIVFKTYSTFSGRRFMTDLAAAQERGYIRSAPHYNTIFKYFEDPNLYPVLHTLIEQTSLPLRSLESSFAVDPTGFAFSRFVRWFDIKYSRYTAEQQWIKAHLMCGVKTNVVTAVEIQGRDAHDGPQLPAMVDATAKNFALAEVSADKGYSSNASHDAIAKHGATPFIAFRANATAGVGGLYAKMFHYFQFKKDEFLAHYHRRSNIESTIMMIKSKFGDSLRSKTEAAARNEVLAKIVCHNICCLISAMYELGIAVELGAA